MTDHYTAWNGQQYAGSPPSGWHQAADGRWWAPGTGPSTSSPQTFSSAFTPTQQPNGPNAKRAGIITGGTFLAIAIGLISLAAANNSGSTPTSNSTTFEALTPQQQAAEFRRFFDEEGIPLKPETTDTQLMVLADATCETASESPDLNSWNQSLDESSEEESLRSAESDQLTNVQRRAVLNASLRIYCPDEASRLGVTQ